MSSFIPELQAKINLLEQQLKYLIREQNSLNSFIVEEEKNKRGKLVKRGTVVSSKPKKKLTTQEKIKRTQTRREMGVGVTKKVIKKQKEDAAAKGREIATSKSAQPGFDAPGYVRGAVQSAVDAMSVGQKVQIPNPRSVAQGEDPTVSSIMQSLRTRRGAARYRDPRVEAQVPAWSSQRDVSAGQAAQVGRILDPTDGGTEDYFGNELPNNPQFGPEYRAVRAEKDAAFADEARSLKAARVAAAGRRRQEGLEDLLRQIGGTSRGTAPEPSARQRRRAKIGQQSYSMMTPEQEAEFGRRVFAKGVAEHGAKFPGKFAETSMEPGVSQVGTADTTVTKDSLRRSGRTSKRVRKALKQVIRGEIATIGRLRKAGGGEVPVLRAAKKVLKGIDVNKPGALGLVSDAMVTTTSQEEGIRTGRKNPSNPPLPPSVGPLGRENKVVSRAMKKAGVTIGDVPPRSRPASKRKTRSAAPAEPTTPAAPVQGEENPAPRTRRMSDSQFAVAVLQAQKARRSRASKTPVVGNPSAVRREKPPVQEPVGIPGEKFAQDTAAVARDVEAGFLPKGAEPEGKRVYKGEGEGAVYDRKRRRWVVPQKGQEVNEVAKTYMKMISENYNRWY
jgi:hypothetical protein